MTGGWEFADVLTRRPSNTETDYQREQRHEYWCEFFAEVLVKVYGCGACKRWSVENKGKKVIRMFTSSCRAYGITLIKDRMAYFMAEQALTSSLSPTDRGRYRQFKKSSRGFSDPDKKR